ncbi:uncharacterized protein LOC123880015 isoform X2 [Maniola jurtina]|uniref:uncharacterized protein LOC123880015 isoform X2 n=1 Tax=Maniola jurtina TaxID=191418 RepID=UPI001E68673F|nr:uncharacterized protein LOC123880015 isoform X2 [Maniola jurtina]
MNTGEAEPSSGLNGRLRPRKSIIPSPKTSKNTRKPDTKPALDRPKRTSTPSKASPNKSDDLTDKADSPATQTLCPYCDKTYFSKQALSNHVRRTHLSAAKHDSALGCLFCGHGEADARDIIRHMVDSHPNQYFACSDCHTRFPSTAELAEHKLNVCEKQKLPYRNKLRQKVTPKKSQKNITGRNDFENDAKDFPKEQGFNGIVISCEVKSSHLHDLADIEDNITTNFILPPGKNLVNGAVVEKNAVIILDDLQWSKRGPPNFSFQNTDADQILSRLGVVHRSPRTGESTAREWLKNNDDSHQKFEKCFDTSFYSKVASNVQENLTKFLDGSCNFNPDPENTIKTRKAKNIVAINTVEGFPILLACEQFSRHGFDGYMPRAIAPKHKWKWDNLENDKSLMSPEQLKRDSHTNNCIISLVSSLDIWTQLCMRRKYESKFNKSPVQKKTEKQKIIGKELKEILESRELPASTSQVVKYTGPPAPGRSPAEFPASLGLVPTAPSFDLKPAVLSGEWVRPRCYVCCACGAQTHDSKGLSSHISAEHPNAQIQHYEIVGDVLLNSDILKHLYVPPSQVNNRTRPLRGFRECTKCRKSISIEDLHQHMLDCAGDTPAVRRKCRHRPFGVRKRRPRLPDNTIRKKIRKDIRTRHSRKNHLRSRPRIRTEVGDAETIRKMLADLPAKRHRVMVKPLNPTVRPRRNLKQTRNKLVMKKRMTEETKNSQRESSSQVTTASAGAEGSKKHPRAPDDRPPGRPFKTTAKRVVSKIIRKNDSFKKNTVTKSKRKIVLQKDPKVNVSSVVETPPTDNGKNSVQVEQLSIENNPERINISDGSYNTRGHSSRSSNNSNNRDNQSPDPNNGQNSNSRDSFAPSQNVPLKHSIASLTASSETHDKSVQFHHLFLVQQECNNLNQHLPAGQRMLFENEAVVTKLDKPPLHFNHRRPLDLQAYQKSKLNKPRKGLNDCIAMLKNKLVEPNTSTLPGHVSVQCGDDEPLDPEPIVAERRHSTTELNADYTQRSDFVHEHIPKKAVEENAQSSASKSRVTRRSSSTRHGLSSRSDKAAEILSSDELMQWRQFYYDSQMLTAQNITETYTKRESSRRRNSLVPTDDLLLQHAMNLDLLSKSKELTKLAEFNPYPSVSTHHNTPKKNNRRDSQKNKASTNVQSTRSKTKDNGTTREKNIELNSNQPNKQTKQSNRSKSVINSSSIKRNSDKNNTKSAQSCNTVAPPEKLIEPYTQGAVAEDTTANLNIEKRISPVNRSSEEHRSQTLSRNTPVVEYTSNRDIPHTHYTVQHDAARSGPLDLSNKITNKKDSFQYVPQEQFPVVAYDTYETLDLSNKNLGTLPVRDTQLSSDDVVDLRINYAHASLQSRYTPLIPELVNTEVEDDNATDLSVRRDEDFPTDLSMNRRDYSTPSNSYEKTAEGHGRSPINYIRDFSNPIRHVEDRCIIVHEYFDENSERIVVVENEVPADFSSRRSLSRSNMSIMEGPMHLNTYANNAESNDENVPADLSGKSRPFMPTNGATITNTVCNYDNYDTQQAPRCLSSDQIIDYRFNRPIQTPSETNFTRPSTRKSISYGEPSVHFDTTLNTALRACITQDLSAHDGSVNKSKNFEQIDYSNSEVPLSLVSKSAIESTTRNSSRISKSKKTETEMTASAYTTANISVPVSITEPIYTSATVVSTVNTLTASKNIETLNITTESNETHCTELSETHDLSSDDKNSESKKLPVTNTLTTTTSTRETDQRKPETVNISNSTANSDQDPETARKIALLPKELVEILGTMPVDHRNQLLNVLPQYVSTSTSPVSHTKTVEGVTCNSGSAGNIVKAVNQDTKEFKFEANSEDGRVNNTFSPSSKNFQFSESSPISVSSSILLTPPTPQLSERYSLQSQESSEIQMYNTRKSRASIEEQTPSTSVDSNKLNVGSNMLAVKRLTNTIDKNDPDRVIDLTVDENSSENTESTNLESVIHTNMINVSTKDIASTAVISKSKVQKTSSDKTASLRAVRIKTPSERHRSMVSENTMVSKQNKSSLTINVQDDTSKESENISPMAIQQAEVSSTQHRPVLRTSETPMESPTEQHLKTEKLIEKKNNDEVPTVTDKTNLVTSTLSKDMNSNFNNECPTIVCNNNSTLTPGETINVSSSKGSYSDFDINDKTKAIHDVPPKENDIIEKPSLFNTPKDSTLIEDDDSDDDISLAVIVKQKQKDSNLVSNSNQNTKIDVERKLSGNKKKRKAKKISKSKEISSDKSLIKDKLEFTKSTPTAIVSEISLINKERVCNESNLIDKISHGKKNSRKGRRLNNAQIIKYSDRKDQNNDNKAYENEINKENNVSSDIIKNTESTEELFKLKTIDQEPNLSSSNTIVNTEINNIDCLNPPVKKDKSKKMLEIHTACGQSTNEISEINKVVSEKSDPRQNDSKLKQSQNLLNSSCIEQSLPQPQAGTETESVLSTAEVSENRNEIIESKSDDLKLHSLNKTDKSKDLSGEKCTKSKKVSIEICAATNMNSEIEETNVTPLRRSRRGKSLFIDSNSTTTVNPACRDNANEQRAPLTKKQLIFSKLLLDEKNHNKTSLNVGPVIVEKNLHKTPSYTNPEKTEGAFNKMSLNINPKMVEENSSKSLTVPILNENKNNLALCIASKKQKDQDLETQTDSSAECDSSIVNENSSAKKNTNTRNTTINKRKISPQCKRKSKKKKSLRNQTKSEDTDVELQQKVNTENEVNQNIVENKETPLIMNDLVSEIPSKINEELVKKDTSEVNVDCISSPTNLESPNISPKPLPIEKRKSCSPVRQDSLQSSKPKKCKLNDENESIVGAISSKEDETGSTVELKSLENCVVPAKNVTCYNKPARRARSKSVVVKSSGADFYDPYDIDLEDMVDKTERKEISAKMSFSSFKSSIAAKTRKLSKTTTAIIDINTNVLVDDNEKVPDRNDDNIGFHKNTLLCTKDGSSDSDDSSKSDVPLKKYAEEKEKKLAEMSLTMGRNKNRSDNIDESNEKWQDKSKARKKHDRSISVNKKEEKIADDKIDSEKDLRSEQFMESFGFFSERKPRKSNLLATKKISETFHIIANDSDDVYFATKDRGSKKGSADNRKEDTKNLKGSSVSPTKKPAKRVRKKKSTTPEQLEPRFCTTSEDQLALLEKRLDDTCEIKSDEDMDAITAKNILESDEVRNLEYDLISNLKEANGLKGFARLRIHSSDELTGNVSEVLASTSNYQKDFNFEATEDSVATKPKRHPEVKDKMYPDLYDNIDMFEDKFDKIKRKCRSQAAAAKQIQTQVDPNLSHKNQKKSDRKKGKKSSKKSQNIVPTKGALKGFDGIKVSILTSDIDMSAIVPPVGNSFKKKKKNTSKRKRERKSSDVSSKSDSDHVTKDSSQRKVDVYEFLDTEDAELFEFRPSTLMERFKSISNKETPSTSKSYSNELAHSSSESVSDGDDFVYMDDLLFSEDETENSVLSCEIGCGKGNNETKKASPLKRKDVIEKNAVMGKIFKHNAVRTDKKNTKHFAKPKANLDQLFDSLLENEPKEQSKDEAPPKEDTPSASTYCSLSPKRKETVQSKRDELPPVVLSRKPEPSMAVTPFEELISQRNAHKYESAKEYTQLNRANKSNTPFGKYRDTGVADDDDCKSKYRDSHDEVLHSPARDGEDEASEAGGVARQRARRKCAVGKQNVLAETWSSESEPDAAPRPTSAESVLAAHARRRRARRRRPAPSARTRPPPLCWPGDAAPEHPQQHGWIVGDSHKKLVTMLAHAKGRKRSHDERRPLLE